MLEDSAPDFAIGRSSSSLLSLLPLPERLLVKAFRPLTFRIPSLVCAVVEVRREAASDSPAVNEIRSLSNGRSNFERGRGTRRHCSRVAAEHELVRSKADQDLA